MELSEVSRVLRAARDLAGLGQGALARRAGVARESVVRYESGKRSPTVTQLVSLLAACEVQAQVTLVARSAALNERVEAVLTTTPTVNRTQIAVVAAALNQVGVTWAVDGATALAAQGLAVGEELSIVLVDDDAFRRWLYRCRVQVRDRWNDTVPLAMGDPRADLDAAFARAPAFCWGLGFLRLRLADGLPDALGRLALDDGTEVAVLPVRDVLVAFPDWSDVVHGVLERLGARS